MRIWEWTVKRVLFWTGTIFAHEILFKHRNKVQCDDIERELWKRHCMHSSWVQDFPIALFNLLRICLQDFKIFMKADYLLCLLKMHLLENLGFYFNFAGSTSGTRVNIDVFDQSFSNRLLTESIDQRMKIENHLIVG